MSWRWARGVLASLLIFALANGGTAAARAVAQDIPALPPVAGAAPADGITAHDLAFPRAVEAQALRIQVQPQKRDPRPDPGIATALAAALITADSLAASGGASPTGLPPRPDLPAPLPPPGAGQHCPTGPPASRG